MKIQKSTKMRKPTKNGQVPEYYLVESCSRWQMFSAFATFAPIS